MKQSKRWIIAAAGILMQVALGAIYAWSVFKNPLAKQFGWSVSQVTLTFTIAIFTLGFSAFVGGLWLKKAGPRVVAMTGGLLYGSGIFLASFSGIHIWWLYATFGLLGGIGLGLAYIVPISVIIKWFPDRKGFMTGIAVGGFGAGAMLTAPIATHLIETVGVLHTFAFIGIGLLITTTTTGYLMENPPAGWVPDGWYDHTRAQTGGRLTEFTLKGAVKHWQLWALWLLLFLNCSAGITIISQEVSIFQELTHASALVAAGMIGIVSIGNALGRIIWASISEMVGRRITFVIMFCIQAGLFWLLPAFHTTLEVTTIVFVILMCYGGGFGTMPLFVADYFGLLNVGSIYGLILTAWGFASAFGPLLIAALRESSGGYSSGLHLIAMIMILSAIIPLFIKAPGAFKKLDE